MQLRIANPFTGSLIILPGAGIQVGGVPKITVPALIQGNRCYCNLPQHRAALGRVCCTREEQMLSVWEIIVMSPVSPRVTGSFKTLFNAFIFFFFQSVILI